MRAFVSRFALLIHNSFTTMKPRRLSLPVLSILALAMAPWLGAQDRVALIIGNNDYPDNSSFPDLDNCVSDANLLKRTLEAVSFKVIYAENASRSAMDEKLTEFETAIPKGGTAVVYFAGHGIEFEGKNYLMGTNAQLQARSRLGEESMDAETFASAMILAGAKSSFIFLDCCRELPKDPGWLTRGTKKRGLAELHVFGDIIIAYAATPGQAALDGQDGNSPYAKALAKWIPSGLRHGELFDKVRLEVYESTQGAQRTWESGSFLTPFVFASVPGAVMTPPAVPVPPPPAPLSAATVAFKGVSLVHELRGSSSVIRRVGFSPDGRLCRACDDSGRVHTWERDTAKVHSTLVACANGPVYSFASSGDGQRLVTGDAVNAITCWDAQTLQTLWRVETGSACWGIAIDATQQNSSLMVADTKGTMAGYDLATGQQRFFIDKGNNAYAVLPGGESFLAGGAAGMERRSMRHGALERAFEPPGDWIRNLAVSPDGRFAASAHGNRGDHSPDPACDNSARVWNLATGEMMHHFPGFQHTVSGVAFTRDSRFLVASSLDGTLAVWDSVTGQERLRHATGQALMDLAVAQDGPFVLTGAGDGRVTLWRLE